MAFSTHIIIAVTDTSLGSLLLRVVSGHAAQVVVTMTGTTPDALLHADQQPVDLVITNHEPPFLDGLELIRQLRLRSTALPIIMLTDDNDVIVSAQSMGVSAILVKPFTIYDLRRELTRLLPP